MIKAAIKLFFTLFWIGVIVLGLLFGAFFGIIAHQCGMNDAVARFKPGYVYGYYPCAYQNQQGHF